MATAMSVPEPTTSFRSSQDFVRALKAAADPPVAGGPSKIEIAQQAWTNTSFYMPSKAEVIVDWILTKLLKEKGKEFSLNPIFDARYWQLFASLSSSQSASSNPNANDARPIKSWLTPLLHRTPLAPVAVAFLTSFKVVPVDQQGALAASVHSCLSIVWHIAAQKMTTELLQECFGAFLCTILESPPNDGITGIGRMISSSYRNSLSNSSNKKKLHQSFLQSHLRNWLSVLSTPSISLDTSLKTSLLDAGLDTLYNLDILRQMHDSRAENPLVERLQTISKSERPLVLEHLPAFLVNYIQAIKKHRGALFSQGSQTYGTSSLEELHANGMLFFISLLGLVDDSSRDVAAWTARMLLLQTVDKENIYDGRQQDGQITFNRLLELILLALGEGWKEEQSECTGLAVECLSIISRIDYDLVLPCIVRILPLLVQTSVTSESYFTFLEILLNYHTKTRTMATLVESLFASISVPRTCPGGSLQVYQTCASSSIMHTAHLERLGRALQTFLTESQTLSTTQVVFDSLKETWEKTYARAQQQEDSGGSRKKRRTSSAFVDTSIDLDDLAINYALVARLSSVVLSSLPMASLSGPVQEEARRLLDGFRTDFLHHALSKTVKILRKRGDAEMWAVEVVLSASLRLLYTLDVSRNLCLPPSCDDQLNTKMLDLVGDEALLPELTLELFRVLLYSLSQGNELSPGDVIDKLLRYIEQNLATSDIVWSGNACHLTRSEIGRAEAALAVMHMVVERWLPDIDRLASSEQLQRLLKTVISIKLPVGPPGQEMRPEHLLLEILHSAQFFEFPNIRTVLLELISNMTSRLDPSTAKLPKTSSMLEKVTVYQHLLLFPMEYFSWQLLSDLISRALTADVALSRAAGQKQGIAEALIVLRVFLQRAYVYCGSIGQDSNKDTADYLISLLTQSPTVDAEFKADFTKATLDLVEVYFSKLLKSSKKHGPGPVLQVLDTFGADAFVDSRGTLASSFIALVNLLVKEFPKNSLPEEIVAALRKLYDGICSSLLPRVTTITEITLVQKDLEVYFGLISGWYSLLCLNKWLETTEGSAVPLLGGRLMSQLISSRTAGSISQCRELDDVGVITFAVLLQELDVRPASEHAAQLDVIVAVYIALADNLSSASTTRMDVHLGKACKRLALDDYVHLVTLISESLADMKHMPSGRLLHLVHLAALLLHEHPSHSLVHIQKFATSCINIFNEHPIFVDGPVALRLEVLEMVSQHCSDQQAALRSQDVAGICLLLSKYLAPSEEHDARTEPRIFHLVVAVLSALVRQRRDLVTHALPHVGMLLRGLLLCMRGCRANLGARQTALVMDTQPRWVGAGHALGAEEARALARLLEGLAAKTAVRVFQAEGAKAESLAKPFAKHAAYVLKAYVEALGAPLVVLGREVRGALMPGLYALCGMVSEHSRDALMVSALDGGGRAALKALWKEYDKQRYVGRG